MKLLAATGNAYKLAEFARILAPLGIEVLSPAEAGCTLAVEENGATFAENACLKAQALQVCSGLGVIADDSGLCVDALGGRPGVHSARYLGEDTPHSEKIQGLLYELQGVPQEKRTARFVCAICCLLPDGRRLECEGTCEGQIAHAPSGQGGFGYDPVFLVGGKSFGELSDSEKDAVSHRGLALRRMNALLRDSLREGGS